MQEIFSLILEMKTKIKKLNEDNKNLKEQLKIYIPYLEGYKKKCDDKKQNKIKEIGQYNNK